MKLASFTTEGRASYGVVEDGNALADLGAIAGAPRDLMALLALGQPGLDWARSTAASAPRLDLAAVQLLAPIPAPRKFLGLGGNYPSHLAEARKINLVRTPGQAWFNKQVSCVNGPYDPVHLPRISHEFDYEGELGVVIGRRCRHVRREDAMDMVAGFVVANDLSVRDWQMRSPTHTLGKSFDTHGPFGPWVVTRDELPDPHALRLRTWVNGELRQDGNTREMTYRVEDMIVELTTAFTLEPGDVLTTGSPAGVGGLMDPPRYLQVGDVVRVEIEGIGAIENRVIAEG
ncbi:2-keto-4-pentenoate hydratase/2-oxohepta-3-ene-1,7-dioic acid hydratase in catechol pathway [Acidovorax soli]|uniref:2-keto-4-pentenoate hydratase/2-oxohepta-3-ene-1,7-dioic acid hydratase in catechol pathway n=1 Tax=Acidovorax soli TaxID=592050 RepID=A0A7X0PCB1_9BURK|nr:fumarylacetoacetate hydrolase family protein [Acidovorax soli]MBB6558906.1 2-keto-4-pentenoate hydratase/2-oxohepta-3-ene-1,7-dioic acid hydratase in catechol pathway [Acidovorax soli]